MSQSHSQSPAQRVDVIASLAMESHLRTLNLPYGFRFASEQVSLETQQMDEQNKLDDLAAHHENLRKLLKAEKPTGTPHLFVLDPERIASGDQDATSTMQALANQQFGKSDRAAVAMLAPTSGFSVAGAGAAKLIKDGIVQNSGLVTLESIEEVTQWLNSL